MSQNIKKSKENLQMELEESLKKIKLLCAEMKELVLNDTSKNINETESFSEDLMKIYSKKDDLIMNNAGKKEEKKVILEALHAVEKDFDKLTEKEKGVITKYFKKDIDPKDKKQFEQVINEKIKVLDQEIDSGSQKITLYDNEIKKLKDSRDELVKKSFEVQKKKEDEYEEKKKLAREEVKNFSSIKKKLKIATFGETSKKQIDDIRRFLSDKS